MSAITLRPYQSTALAVLWDWMRCNAGNPALVLPTGAGKSPLMAAIARDAVDLWQGRVCILAHVQELVGQNAAALHRYAPELDVGIYAAGLRRRDRFNKVLVCQIQSVASIAAKLGRFDLILVDEAHRIPLNGEGRYLQFIEACRRFNPHLRVVGLTATPYRLQGRAVPVCGDEHILTEVAYEARIADLIAEGYLSRLTTPGDLELPDLSAVHVRGGEYVEAELADAMLKLVERSVIDMLARSAGRRCGIVFCVNVKHALAVRDELLKHGESVCVLYQGSEGRKDAIEGHKSGAYRWLVNVNIASEGYDNPMIDVIAKKRPTKSPGLYYQQIGRGLRLAPGKTDCLILDYAGNVLEHGPVDAIRVQKARPGRAAEVQTSRVKKCPSCSALLPIGARVCSECEHSFASLDPAHLDRPIDAPVLSTDRPRVVTTHAVHSVKYERGKGKQGKPDHLRAIYQCGLRRFTEFVCIEHGGRARAEAFRWWQSRSGGTVPRTVEEALPLAYGLRSPVEIVVDETEKYPRVLEVRFAETGAAPANAQPPRPVDSKAPAWLQAVMRAA